MHVRRRLRQERDQQGVDQGALEEEECPRDGEEGVPEPLQVREVEVAVHEAPILKELPRHLLDLMSKRLPRLMTEVFCWAELE